MSIHSTETPIPQQEAESAPDHLYVLSFNAPAQFEALLHSFEQGDPDLLSRPRKFLVNNSTEMGTWGWYDQLCQQFGFEHILQNNLGISRGRQFVAEHFGASKAPFYVFFEDDMLLHTQAVQDKFGFPTRIHSLYDKARSIMARTGYDYLKLSFCEVFGENSKQWAYWDLSEEARRTQFEPGEFRGPLPLTHFSAIEEYDGLGYAEGEVFYCNWPLFFSREGNHKLFLADPLLHPSEGAFMARSFEMHRAGSLKAAVLLASPINHNRLTFYSTELRKEY